MSMEFLHTLRGMYRLRNIRSFIAHHPGRSAWRREFRRMVPSERVQGGGHTGTLGAQSALHVPANSSDKFGPGALESC